MQAILPFPDIGPDIFSISLGSFHFALRWYAMAYIVGALVGWRIVLRAIRRPALWPNGTAPMTAEQVEALMTWIILGVVFGGRIGYTMFYQPAYYLGHPAEILKVWQGGMSFHGGFLGVVVAVALFSRRHGLALWSVADLLAIAVPTGLFLGRIANFINGELWGRPTDLPWGVIFPGQAAQECSGVIGLCARHPSQLYEALLEGTVLGTLLLILAFRRGWFKTPGKLTGLFFAGYGTARFIVELFRQADAQYITAHNPMGYVLQMGPLGLSMGQLLSLPMIIVGLALFGLARNGRLSRP